MMEQENIFDRSSKLLTGIIYQAVKRYPTFIHLKSYFNDCWYNYLIPTVIERDFSWDEAQAIITSEAKTGFNISLYIHSSRVSDYEKTMKEKGHTQIGSEVYMVKKLIESKDPIKYEYEQVTDATIEQFVKMALIYFPEWTSCEQYARYFHTLSQTNSEPLIQNFLLKKDSLSIGSGGLVISRDLHLAYLHNTGILEAYRRHGYFSDLVHYSENTAVKQGVTELFALVEKDGGSYYALLNLGFTSEETYYLFSTESQPLELPLVE